MEWQPIETAPKDGRAILAYWPAPEYAPDAPAIVQTGGYHAISVTGVHHIQNMTQI